jgi:hypothetical protein
MSRKGTPCAASVNEVLCAPDPDGFPPVFIACRCDGLIVRQGHRRHHVGPPLSLSRLGQMLRASRLRSTAACGSACSVDEQHARTAIATLADSMQHGALATGVLARDQAQPST